MLNNMFKYDTLFGSFLVSPMGYSSRLAVVLVLNVFFLDGFGAYPLRCIPLNPFDTFTRFLCLLPPPQTTGTDARWPDRIYI
jgi:hypothetical protein